MNPIPAAVSMAPKSSFWTLQNVITATALQLAVAGVAMALFNSQLFLVLCLVVTGITVVYLRATKGPSEAFMKKMSGEIKQEDRSLQIDTKKTEELTRKLAAQSDLFKKNESDLKGENKRLIEINQKLQADEKAWKKDQEAMDANLRSLKEAKTALETSLDRLRENYQALGLQFQQFLASQLKLKEGIGTLESDVAKMSQLKGSLDSFSEYLKKEKSGLDADMENQKKGLQQVTREIVSYRQAEQVKLEEMKKAIAALQGENNRLAQQIKEMGLEEKRIEQSEEELKPVATDLHRLNDSFHEGRKEMEAQLAQEEKDQARILEEKNQLLKEVDGLTALLAELQRSIASTATEIDVLEKRKREVGASRV